MAKCRIVGMSKGMNVENENGEKYKCRKVERRNVDG